jgi:dCTP deaminase
MSNYFNMILTGKEIEKQVKIGNIMIKPFSKDRLNPNSYNYRISDRLIVFDIKGGRKVLKTIKIPKEGYVLRPHQAYLASTYESLGSKKYAMSLIGRSSLGRLGLFLQISANLGHTGSTHKWTLELVCVRPFRIYPNMIIGQISFWTNEGEIVPYLKGYSKFDLPERSHLEEVAV